MERILLVARNVFRSILHGKIVYLWVAGLLLMFLQAAPAIFMNMGNEAVQTMMRKRAVSGGLSTWSTMCIALAIFVGASALGNEVSRKTIVNVFARPIRRWEFLVGKWLGVQCFAFISMAVGLLVSFGLSRYLGAQFETKVLWLALGGTAAAILLYGGLAIALSTVMSQGVAGALTVIVAFLPGVVTLLVANTDTTPHAIGVVLDYVIPPGYTSHYAETIPAPMPRDAFGRGGFGRGNRGPGGPGGDIPPVPQPNAEPNIDYNAEGKVLLQNVAYAGVFFALGCLIFLRRDLRLT
jgi:ABC-type transport system involved in multi-copper enzyme maturation permease subunit